MRLVNLLALLALGLASLAPAATATPGPTLVGTVAADAYTLDPATGAATFFAATGASVPLFDDLTYDPDSGDFYGITTSPPELFRLDGLTLAATSLGTITSPTDDIQGVEGLALNPADGVLSVTGGSTFGLSNVLYVLDPATAVATRVIGVSGTTDGGDVDSLQWIGGVLYGIDSSGATDSKLYTIDTTTGIATLVGPTANGVNDMGYDASTGTLWTVSSSTNELFTVSVATGAATLVGSTNVDRVVGFEAVPASTPAPPVPELPALALVGVGILGISLVAARRR